MLCHDISLSKPPCLLLIFICFSLVSNLIPEPGCQFQVDTSDSNLKLVRAQNQFEILIRAFRHLALDNYPLFLEFDPVSRTALASIGMTPKRKKKDNGEEEGDDESYDRWAETWISACVTKPNDKRMFNAAVRDISFFAQIEVNFNFSSISNLDEDLRRNEEERLNSLPDRATFTMVCGGAYERTLRSAYSELPVSGRVIKYEGSISFATLSQSERATPDDLNKILPFLGTQNFGMVVRYMVVLSKLHWFRTNHHVGMEKDGIARSLSDALDRALRAMPIDNPSITESDVKSFFLKRLHTLAHWASTHFVCRGLYMPSQKLMSGFYYWVRHPNLVKKLTPENDVRRRLGAAPTNLAKYYLVTDMTSTCISSPGWGLYSSIQLREIRDTVTKTSVIQERARQNLEFNRIKIDSADSQALFRSFQSCRKDERYAYHSSHSWMNLDSQVVLPECKSIGLAGMLVCALHPGTTIPRAPCFAPEGGRKSTEMAIFKRDRIREMEMNTSLARYDKQLFTRLKWLSLVMESGTSKIIRLLSHKIQFSSEAGFEIENIDRSLGMQEATARSLAEQMSSYLQDTTKSVTVGRDSDVFEDEGEEAELSEEVD